MRRNTGDKTDNGAPTERVVSCHRQIDEVGYLDRDNRTYRPGPAEAVADDVITDARRLLARGGAEPRHFARPAQADRGRGRQASIGTSPSVLLFYRLACFYDQRPGSWPGGMPCDDEGGP
jgi:hypothetical protein